MNNEICDSTQPTLNTTNSCHADGENASNDDLLNSDREFADWIIDGEQLLEEFQADRLALKAAFKAGKITDQERRFRNNGLLAICRQIRRMQKVAIDRQARLAELKRIEFGGTQW